MENSDSVENAVVQEDKKLKKDLTFIQLLFLSLGGIIGSGWLFGVNAAAATAGPIVFLSWIIGGIMVIFIALTYAEVSSMIPRSGAIVRYPHFTHGSYTGYILGWAYLLSAITVPAIEAIAAVTYISAIFPNSISLVQSGSTVLGNFTSLTFLGITIAILLMIGFFFLNYFGIKFLGRWNEYFVYWKLVIPTLTFILLFFMFRPSNYTTLGGGLNPIGTPFIFTAIPSAGIVFSYLGFRQALEFSGEAKNPQKDVPRALILSVLIGMVIYTLLQIAYTGAIRASVSDLNPFAWGALATNASAYSSSPIYTVFIKADIAGFGAWAEILLIDAVISPSGTGWVYMGTSTRVLYGLSTDGYYPSRLMSVEKKTGIPLFALILSVVIGSIFIAPFPSWYILVGFISSATVFTYIMGGVSLRVFRKTAKNVERPFRLSYSRYIAPTAFISASLIVYWSGYITLTILMFIIMFGLPVYMIYYGIMNFKISPFKVYTAGIAYWIVMGLSLLVFYVYIIVPAAANIGKQIQAPGSVFNYFGIMYPIVVMATLIVTFLMFEWVPDERKKEIKSGVWLIFYMLFMLLMAYIGAFGPYVTPLAGSAFPISPVIPFPYDTILVIIVSLLFFYFAVSSGYDEADVQDILAEQGVPLKEF
ncbi:MAG: APC family permease [Candidatus Thermoplasmatota archaeon]|nr:APC family permease [Candidatus Thermoplasmatota archaeon]